MNYSKIQPCADCENIDEVTQCITCGEFKCGSCMCSDDECGTCLRDRLWCCNDCEA